MSSSELKDLGITPKLWLEWQLIMNALWNHFRQKDLNNTRNNDDNKVTYVAYLNSIWSFYADFVDGKYIEVVADKNGERHFSLRYTGSLKKICDCLDVIIK